MDGRPNPYAKLFPPPGLVAKPAPKLAAEPAVMILPAKVKPNRASSGDGDNTALWLRYCGPDGKVYRTLIGKSGERFDFVVTDERDVPLECRASEQFASK
jgi:hypothetical protein